MNRFEKIVSGNFNQACPNIFGYSAGKQCSCITLTSVCWTTVRKITLWKDFDLDFILHKGDKVYKDVNINRYLNVDELPTKIVIDNSHFDIFVIRAEDFLGSSLLEDTDTIINTDLFFSDNVTGIILFIEGYCVSILKESNNRQVIYAFDSHSRDSEGNIVPDGSSILIKFSSIKSFWDYIVLTYGSSSCQLVYIKTIPEENKTDTEKSLVKFRRSKLYYENSKNKVVSRKESSRKFYQKNSADIKVNRKRCYQENAEQKKESQKQHYQNNTEQKKESQKRHYQNNTEQKKESQKRHYQNNTEQKKESQKRHYQNNTEQKKDSRKKHYLHNTSKENEIRKKRYRKNAEQEKESRSKRYQTEKLKKEESENLDLTSNIQANSIKQIENFKKTINEGPFFICVCCNRCLYKRSVILFNEDRYLESGFCPELQIISSFDNNFYICKTCDKKILKHEVPCQSVKNNLEVHEMPSNLQDLNKIERTMISQRILFSKIKIMPKGQFPKIKGIVCNIPVETEVCNVLPRTFENSNLIFMKLKRKLCYNAIVIQQPVRPEKVFSAINYLKNVNHLYKDINVQNVIPNNAFDICFINENPDDIDFNVAIPDSISIEFVNDSDTHEIKTLKDYENEDIFSSSLPSIEFIDDKYVQQITSFNVKNDEFDNEDPMSEHRLNCTETTLISKCPHVIADDENIVVAPGQGKTPLNILKDENVEMLAFPDLFPTGKFGYSADRDVKLTHTKYFNQRLLNYTQRFAGDADYIFFANFVSQQTNLRNQINVAMRKVSGSNINAGMLTDNFKERVRNFVANEEAYTFMNTVKGSPAYWKNMLSDVLAMVKQIFMLFL